MTRPATGERKRRFTLSRQKAEILAKTAKANGCTAAVVYPDGMRIELTPVDVEAQAVAPKDRPFANMR